MIGHRIAYAYSGNSDPKLAHNLTSLTDPRGVQALALNYDNEDKLTSLKRGDAAVALSCAATASVTDPNGHLHAYRHDGEGRPLSVTEGSATTAFTYNDDGLVTGATLPEGNSLSYAYQGGEARGRGNLLSISENAGPRGAEEPSRLSRFSYDPFFNLLRQMSTPEGLTLNHSLDGRGNVTSTVTNLPGISLSYSYNGYGQLTSMTDPLQGTTGYTYHPESSPGGGGGNPGASGRRLDGATGGYLKGADSGGLAVSYSRYDQAGNLELLSRSDGLSLSSSYDPFNQVTAQSLSASGSLSPLSGTVSYGRDSNGNILSWNETWGALSRQITSTYDQRNNPLSRSETGMGTTQYGYDGEDLPISVTDPSGRRLSLAYNANDLVRSATLNKEDLTATTQFTYDGNGNLTSVTDPLGRVTQFTYDGFDRIRSVKDPLNNSTVIARAEMGNLQTLRRLDSAEKLLAQSAVVSDPLGRVVSRSVRELESGRDVSYAYGYEQGGRLVTITDPLGRVSSVTKNQKGQVIKEEDAAGNTVEYLYESGSNRVSQKIETEKGPSGSSQTHTTRYEYVQGDKLSKIVENVGTPLQRVTTFLYDEKGNLIGSVDPAGHAVSHEYDPQGRRIRTTRELEKGERVTAAMAYDALSNLTSLTDSFGNRTEYAYDPLGRLSKITYPDGSTLEYGYDSAGNLLREKQRSGTVVTNTYDNGNRLISRTITKASGVEGTSTESYVYDGLSRLTKGTNDVSVVERRYDSLSRLIEEVQDGKSVQYGYDRVGNPTSLRYPNSRLVEREFDLLNRISRVKQGSDVISTMEFLGRSYRLASKGYQNGDLVKYLYDQGRRLTSSETKNKNQAILQSFGWGYDSLDLKSFEKRIHDGGKGDAFSYDALKRLTNVTFDSPTPETPGAAGVKSRSITLDKLDNILKITDNENAMVTEIVGELEGQGRLLNQYSRFNDLPLEHDKNGNLSAKGSRLFTYDYKNRLIRSSKGDDAVTFTYDVFGRQTSRTDVSGTCHYFYAGDQKIEERNSAGQVTKHYLWGNGIDELLRLDVFNGSSSTPYYVHSDAIGSTTTVTDENGSLVERVRYDAYGIPTFTDALGQTLKKSTVGNTTLFQGREYDYDLALYNYRARYFDPTLGRFLQTDPLGYKDSMNLYQGMNMNPVNFVDPWGLMNDTAVDRAWAYFRALFSSNPEAQIEKINRQEVKTGEFLREEAVPRLMGTGQAIGGALMMKAGATLGSSGIGAPVGLALMTIGADNLQAGARTMVSGEHIESMGHEALRGGASLVTNDPVWQQRIADYGEMSYNAFLGGAIYRNATQSGQLLSAGSVKIKYVELSTKYGPMNQGPLADDIANTFRSSTYSKVITSKPTTLYRVIGKGGNPLGSYWIRTPPSGPIQSIIDSALLPKWGNSAMNRVRAIIPPGTTLYEGFAASQGGLVGGGNQIYIPQVDPNWIQGIVSF